VRDKWQNRLRYLLVDEYQDTNASQYQLLRLLAGVRAAFTAVGDDDQAIYGWRGADIANLRGLPRDYPNLKLIKLEQNYRSTVRILKAANALISHNEKLFDKRLWSDLGHGDPITVNTCPDKEKEAESVVMKLQAHRFQHQGQFRDYAILYRGNFQARAVEKFLRNQRLPYLLSGGQSFFDKAEIKDLTAYLRLLANPDDDPAFIRAVSTPRRGVGTSTLQALGNYAGERRISLFAGACEQGFAQRIQTRQLASLVEFCEFIERLQERAGREPAAQVIAGLLTAISYEAWLYDQDEARAAQSKWSNVQEFCDWLSRKGERGPEDAARTHPDHRPDQHARPPGFGRRRRPAVDAARCQGPGVQACLPDRHRGGRSATPRSRGRKPHRGRAPPDVCRDHACPTVAAPELRRETLSRVGT
jgi:ATP-dependent DNA helicase Rep